MIMLDRADWQYLTALWKREPQLKEVLGRLFDKVADGATAQLIVAGDFEVMRKLQTQVQLARVIWASLKNMAEAKEYPDAGEAHKEHGPEVRSLV